jgi:dienelactone hydrolase
MRRSLLFLLTLILSASADTTAQIIQEFKTTTKSVIGYIEYLPKDYHSNSNNYPVVIFLHGLGQRGPNSTDPAVLKTGYDNLVFYGPPKYVKDGTQFPFLLISPQLKNSYGDWPGWYVMEVIEHVKTYLRIDPKRIYLTGTSLGGGGTWIAAQDYPDYFACIAPVAGSTNTPSKACLLASTNLPVWAFHGEDDNVVPYSKSVNMVNAINACNPPIKAELKTYYGIGHNAFVPAYDIGYTYQTPNIYDWMLQWVNDHSNKIPKANAGPDVSATLPATSAIITGTGTDTDGSIVQYNWAQIAGLPVVLTNTTSSRVTVSGFITPGIYTFRLVVKDDKGSISSDDVNFYVKTSVNALPVAKAGSDKTVVLPANATTITGSGTDTDGYIASYTWSKISGGAATLSGASTSVVSISGMAAGNYTFRLTVKDDNGGTSYDDMNVYVNYAPSVNAGSDKAITLPTSSVTLMGTATDSDGTISSYTWSKFSGASASLSGTSTANMTASNLLAGSYVFRLTVKDNRGTSKYDDVQVTVNPAIGSNVAPTVTVGSDRLISLPTNSVAISGTASDSDGSIASYNWIKLSGGNATLSGTNTPTLSASSLVAGTYVFQLTVTDDDGASKSDDVKVTVNAAPIVTAGSDRLVSLPTNYLTIYGSASDTDGSISTWTWSKVSGGSATLSGTTTRTLSLSGLVAGEYVFRLTVKDDRGGTSSDDVNVIVNIPPVANAGSNQTITLPTTSTTLPGTGTDQDGTIAKYEWTKVSGGTVTMSGTSGTTLSVQDMVAGTYVFRLAVTDNRGSLRHDDVTVIVNIPPVSNAGSDKTLTLPQNAIVLTGTASDPDGLVTYTSWIKVSGGTAYMSGNSTLNLSLTGLVTGTYVFRLTVKDDRGALKADEVTVVVNSSISGSSLPDVETIYDKEINPLQESESSDQQVTFGISACSGCRLFLYNEKLDRIYDDRYTPEAITLLSERGLYYYKVLREGQIVKSGKIFRQ